MSTAPGCLASLDGEITLASEAVIPATDEGLLRGDGAFEVMRVYDGKPFAIDEHLARLARTGANLRLPVDLEAVRADAYRLLAQAGDAPEHELLRVVITRGGRRLLLTEPMPPAPARLRLMSTTYAPTRILDGIKSLSYAANMLASRLAREAGFDDALLVTPHGRVLEAPTSSIFWVIDGRLETTPLSDHVLASITRSIVLDVADVTERSITLQELYAADEAFLASTTREAHSIAEIDDHEYPGPGPVTQRTAAAVAERIRAKLAA